MLGNTEVLKQLANLCHATETGTFFITTTENKACHIIIDKGRITALSYGRDRGEKVVSALPFMKIERFSFKQQVKMPLSSRAFVEESQNILQQLGLHLSQLESASTSKKRVYRGVEIEEEIKVPTLQKNNAEPAKKKPSRMYRGQVLDD
jgi:hypothetical protein